ncbi:MAG: hypothetical protein CMP88_10565 [Gammaproteobacteria bacterium]|nr:hypothetical protein [Gammaproteobacteria bacterium]
MRRQLLFLSLFLFSLAVESHEVRPAYLQIDEIETQSDKSLYQILWKQPVVQNRRLPLNPIFPENCEVNDRLPIEITNGALLHHWITDCELKNSKIHIDGLSVTLTDVMVRWNSIDGESKNYLLRPEDPTLDLGGEATQTSSYLLVGIEHLVFGIDHVLFVMCLFFLIRNPIALIKTITSFTVAHSITLALSVLQLVELDQGPIEAVIALSIVFLARELLVSGASKSSMTLAKPWLMAFFFGLLHGLGFAGALREIGLPDDSFWSSLLLFNIGIEFGQLMVIAILAGLTWLLAQIKFRQQGISYASWIVGMVAAYWTIDRTLLLI